MYIIYIILQMLQPCCTFYCNSMLKPSKDFNFNIIQPLLFIENIMPLKNPTGGPSHFCFCIFGVRGTRTPHMRFSLLLVYIALTQQTLTCIRMHLHYFNSPLVSLSLGSLF